MEVFDLQEGVIENYADYIRSFLTIKDERMHQLVEDELGQGFLWPKSLVQLNPAFESGRSIQALVDDINIWTIYILKLANRLEISILENAVYQVLTQETAPHMRLVFI